MTILIFLLVSYFLLSISLFFVFQKAGEAGWQALVPGLNFIVWSKLIGRPAWWAALLLIPIVNIFIYASLCVNMVRSFKKYLFWHSAIAVIYAPLAFFYLGLNPKEEYDGPTLEKEKAYFAKMEEAKSKKNSRALKKLEEGNPYKKSVAREWVEAIVFAVFAAAFIRMFLIEAYVIPTSSMEGSLLVGDFLFVSKASYGMRTPSTVIMVPLLHNRIPFLDAESYVEEPNLPYKRLPALENIDRNDPVVFNYPEGDSVHIFPDRTWSVYDYRRGVPRADQIRAIKDGRNKLVARPIDKKDHYIKRCVGIPGDSIQIIDRQLYINGEPAENPEFVQYRYLVKTTNPPLNTRNFTDWGISQEDLANKDPNNGSFLLTLNQEQIDKIKSLGTDITVDPIKYYSVKFPDNTSFRDYAGKYFDFLSILREREDQKNSLMLALTEQQFRNLQADSTLIVQKYDRPFHQYFPHDPRVTRNWTVDDYGPVYIPKKGETLTIDFNNLPFYRRVISVYEGNDLKAEGGKIFINGQEANSYTFKMNYYWMMGDNRHGSEDSRIWGFVPEDHIVGKPLIIWFSYSSEGSNFFKRVKWNRIFKPAGNI